MSIINLTLDQYLAHYGVLRKSGRYPWGSGDGPQRELSGTFNQVVAKLKQEGYSDTQIAEGFKITTTELRQAKSIEANRLKKEKILTAQKHRDDGHGYSEIGRLMGLNESSVRSLLAPGVKDKVDNLQIIADKLKEDVDRDGFIDIGAGVENRMGITDNKLKNAVAILKEEGYVVHPVQVPQQFGLGQTTVRTLTRPGTTYREAKANRDNIRQVSGFSQDGGRTFTKFKPPLNIDPKRVEINYSKKNAKDEEIGGGLADGVIYVRPGVPDVSLGKNTYAQVRIAVGGTHYLKGMAVYKDDLPDGIDLMFNTNKTSTGNKLDAMKKMEIDEDTGKVNLKNPFGSQIKRQLFDGDEERPSSAMNMVNEETDWGNWSKTISTQVLSKQPPQLAKQQLDLTYERKKADLDEIMALTNPVVRKHLLEKYADGTDSSAVHLKASHMPRQGTHVILPLRSLKPNEVYAPNYDDGDLVALIRYPHGGKFEIPELVVNNKNREGRSLLGVQAPDAIGINAKVAERLSGADFDGDTVVVIPNKNRQIRSEPALAELKNFDPKREYKAHDGMKTIDQGRWDEKSGKVIYPIDPKTGQPKKPNSRYKGTQMGYVSNLITDMTILGASNSEIARAVKHSMVVIDAEKHHLDYELSARKNGISALQKKYQGKAGGGSATLISRATSMKTVDQREPRKAKDGGPIDPATGKLVTVPKTFVDRDGVTRSSKVRVAKLADTDDAYTLVSEKNTQIENVYAAHSNRLKALANDARKEVAAFRPPRINPSAKAAYKAEVDSLNAKLDLARRNKPLERQAQIFANAVVTQKVDANPHLDPSDLKKIRTQALAEARNRTGADKIKIEPTDKEWAAIQAGAISHSQLKQILDNANLEKVRELATPQTKVLMTPTKTRRAKAMAAQGYTQAEIASQLGVSVSTLERSLT